MTTRSLFSRPAGSVTVPRYLIGTGLALWALFMALQPDPGFDAPWPWLAFFWAVQIGVGLAVLHSILSLVGRADRAGRIPLVALVPASGVIGAALLAPLYWLIGEGLMESLLGFPATIDNDDDRGPPLAFGPTAVWLEFLDIVGPVTAAWVLISWPRLLGVFPSPLVVPNPSNSDSQPSLGSAPETSLQSDRPAWRAVLPSELGDDLIAVTSELQYLRVWTSRGCALVLGSLQQVEDEEGAAGIRLHRSWWVHARHVRSVRRRGEGAVCELSNGREVPVSRRRKTDVLVRFGDGTRYGP